MTHEPQKLTQLSLRKTFVLFIPIASVLACTKSVYLQIVAGVLGVVVIYFLYAVFVGSALAAIVRSASKVTSARSTK